MSGPVHIALMGIDGAGKSTIARDLVRSLQAGGCSAEVVSYKRAMLAAAPPTSSILAHVAFASLKCQYAEAVGEDRALDLNSLLSTDDLGASFPAAERRLRAVPIEDNAAQPFLSSALLEVVGGFWVHAYVQSRLRAGITVVDESYPFKHALKNVLFAQRLSAAGSPVHIAAQQVLEVAQSLFGTALAPTCGYWIDTDPKLALRWRTAAGETTTPFEDYGLMGDRGEEAFLAMQDDCRRAFETATRQWRWHHLTMHDVSLEENLASVVSAIEQTAGLVVMAAQRPEPGDGQMEPGDGQMGSPGTA